MKKIGLALGSGGARGLAHIKFLQAMDELKIQPSIISGTSIGSIIGAFYAAGLSGRDIEKVSDQVGFRELTKMLDVAILNPSGVVKGQGVLEFLQNHLPVTTFEELRIPLRIVATDFWNRQEYVFESGDLLAAIRASISIPFVFKPVKTNDIVMTDGAAVNPVPMSVIRDDCELLIAIDVSGYPEPPRKNPMPNLFEAVMDTFQTMETAYVENQVSIYKPEIYVRPRIKNIQILDFHKDREIYKLVADDVTLFRQELERLFCQPPQKKRPFFFFKDDAR